MLFKTVLSAKEEAKAEKWDGNSEERGYNVQIGGSRRSDCDEDMKDRGRSVML